MKITTLRTIWISLVSLIATAGIAFRAVFRSLTGQLSRRWIDHTLQVWSSRVLELAKVEYQVFNPHQTTLKPGQPTIVMCNHSSLYDIPLSFKAFPHASMRMLGKVELSRIPVLGKAMRDTEFPFINRHNRKKAIHDLHLVKKIMEHGIIMWIAPEGTRSKTGKLAPFKKGGFITAIQTQATIIPIGIRGATDILPARSFQLNLNQKAEIHIGKAVNASEYTLANKEALISEVFEEMSRLVKSD